MAVIRTLVTRLGYKIDDKDLKKYQGQTSSLTSTLGSMAVAAAAAGVALASMIGKRLISEVFQANVEFEKLQAQMDAVTGSAANGEKAFSMLRKFATETPFQLQQLASAFVKLKTLGLDPNEESMRALGDIASFFGQDIGVLTDAIQSAVSGSYEPLRRFGIFVKKEGDKLKVTVDGVTTEVANNAEALNAFLVKTGGANSKFAGSMAKQMNTLGGRISNIKDALFEFLVGIGEAGFNDALRELLTLIIEIMGGGGDAAQTIGEQLGNAIRQITEGIKWVKKNWDIVVAAFYKGVDLIMSLPFLLYLEDIITWLRGGDSLIGSMFERPEIQEFIEQIKAVGAEVLPEIIEAFEELKVEAMGLFGDLIKGAGESDLSFKTFLEGVKAIIIFMLKLLKVSIQVATGIVKIFRVIAPPLIAIFGPIIQFWIDNWGYLFKAVSFIFDLLLTAWTSLWNSAKLVFAVFSGDFEGAVKIWLEQLKLVEELMNSIGIDITGITGKVRETGLKVYREAGLTETVAGGGTAGAKGGESTTNNTQSVGSVNVNITGVDSAASPDKVEAAARTGTSKGMADQARDTNRNSAGAVT